MDTLPPSLPTVPPGCTWRYLNVGDHPLLAPVWRDLHSELSGAPFWRTWLPVLVDRESGWFDLHFMRVLALFDSDEALICCAAEVENFEQINASQILFWVPLSWRSRGLGGHALQAAMALVRQRGRVNAQAECREDNAAAVALFRCHGMRVLLEDLACPGYSSWGRRLDGRIFTRRVPALR